MYHFSKPSKETARGSPGLGSLNRAAMIGAGFILADPIFQGLAISFLASDLIAAPMMCDRPRTFARHRPFGRGMRMRGRNMATRMDHVSKHQDAA